VAGGGEKGLPSHVELRRFIAAAPRRVGKREISRAFGLGPEHRGPLRALLRELAEEGVVAPAGAGRFAANQRLPETMMVEVTGLDREGEALARPLDWRGEGPPPAILMEPEPRGRAALALGARVLARLRPIGNGRYKGRTLKRLDDRVGRILGVFRAAVADAPRHPDAGRIVPADRRARAEWRVPPGEASGAEPGEIVEAVPLPSAGWGLKPARVIARLGREGEARSVSRLVLALHDIPLDFSADALAEAAGARATGLSGREDLRALPLVTIDGADARDFDDAVHAEATSDGFRLIVAIADVAHYVRPGAALDRDARLRGNSVYFPDRVVPMLPEALSNGWCSLRPGEERGCLFVEMRIDGAGRKHTHRFGRGLMKSAARLTYEEVQAGHEAGAMAALLDPLYGAFRALLAARRARGTLDLDLPEQQVELDAAGKIRAIRPRPRLDSHRLIEEFMVLANVAAAEELEARHAPCVYRVHAPPSPEKLATLRELLASFDISLPPGDRLHPRDLDAVLRRVAGRTEAPLVNEMILRSQSQAAYSPDNIGHFGLGLARYAHFTSPIRRYADLLIHRALIAACRLGPGGLGGADGLEETAAHITLTERRAASAERAAIERYLASFLAERVGENFAARISGVTRAVIFVTLAVTGASGIVPISSLPDDEWMFDQDQQMLSGRRSRVSYRLAQPVEVRLMEANPLTGGLVFHLFQPAPPRPGPARGRRSTKFHRP